jgi:hypothetical protein
MRREGKKLAVEESPSGWDEVIRRYGRGRCSREWRWWEEKAEEEEEEEEEIALNRGTVERVDVLDCKL